MKLLNVMMIQFLLMGGLSLSTCNRALAGDLPKNNKAISLSEEIKQKVAFPQELIYQEVKEKVTVEFKIKENKSIEVVSITTKDDFLKSYVKKQIENLHLENILGFEGKLLEISLLFEN